MQYLIISFSFCLACSVIVFLLIYYNNTPAGLR